MKEKTPNISIYYRLLNIKRSCTKKDIERAYKKLALKYHPDKNLNNPEIAHEKFCKINEAYTYLLKHHTQFKAKPKRKTKRKPQPKKKDKKTELLIKRIQKILKEFLQKQ
jgi:DnaJ-class molecular chaperone